MYPARKEADAAHSGTGVFYQAMPAVGADGKNIMKLIPVQMVDGKFVQTQISKPKTDPKPRKAMTIKVASAPVHMGKTAALSYSATQQIVREQVSIMKALPNQVGVTEQCSDLGNSLNKYPLQQTLNFMAEKPLMATLATNCGKPVRLPVTVKSPALPRGQYLQIPSNAQVRTVPVSELPPGIKKQIFTSSTSSSSSSGLPSVVYVSPVTTVNQSTTPPSNSAPEILSKTSDMTSPSSGRSKPHLKLIPKVSQRPNSPMKWVIEEEDGFRASTLDPLISPSVTSQILRAVAEREVANKHCEIMTKETPDSSLSLAKSEKGHENALVMCNGKVFFVAKKCSQPFKLKKREADPPTAAAKSYKVKKTSTPPSQNVLRQDSRIIIPDESDEVIDLCNDDCPDDLSQQAASGCMSTVTHLDEDNVIFVSYIPPKSESGSTQDLIQKALEKEQADQTGTRGLHSVTEQKSLDGATSSVSETSIGNSTVGDHLASDGRDGRPSLRGGKPGESTLVRKVKNVTHVCGAAVMNTNNNNRASNTNSQQSNSTQQLESMEVDLETVSSADPSTSESSSGICSQIADTSKMKSSTDGTLSLAPKPFHMADHLLRQIFGITSVVKICLQRIDEASTGAVPEEALQNESVTKQSVEDVQETNGLKEKELFLQDLYDPQETESNSGLISVKRVNLLTEQKLSGDLVTPGPHTDIRPIKCSLFKQMTKAPITLKSKYSSGQSSDKGILRDIETEPVIDYVEPIDDDLPNTEGHDILKSQDSSAHSQTQTCINPNTNTRRMGRARKRTMCPCCIPGALDPAVKSSARLEEPEMRAWMTEPSSKKGRGTLTKARRKDRKSPGRINCVTAKNKQRCKAHKVPASEILSATSMDSDELKRHKQINRLKELLKEKEASLEMMTNSMISD
ncbi:ligand-dependent nuclear receptor-interacting factor 1 [Thunnus albacares]|uniref:ligand-dependent nuclear receptor-interacting factor 1 n=1 Tax=Thunnus albacares TaxID=8236 RepID=UPI001CF670DE|nr:ligand-dependent nuclear receptor-interacting factor 1 [Thunnus albacares]